VPLCFSSSTDAAADKIPLTRVAGFMCTARLNFADGVTAAESRTITEKDAIALLRYFANLAASPNATALARDHFVPLPGIDCRKNHCSPWISENPQA